MTATFFELYERRKIGYKPGMKWKDKGGHLVKEVEILSQDEADSLGNSVYVYNDSDYDTVKPPLVTFRILRSSSWGRLLGEDQIVAWSKEYMDDFYEPIIE